MKGKLLLALFALPFAGFGLWMAWSVAATFYDGYRVRDWAPVPARLIEAGYETHSGDDSDTYEAYARYTYTYAGRDYTNERVALAAGADNIGDFQQRLGKRLAAARQRGEPVTVYVNPDAPGEAVVDRQLRWGLVGFKMIFVLVFGGVGAGILVFLIRMPRKRDPADPAFAGQPWLARNEWQTATIRSNSRAAMFAAIGFAAFWNLVSAPLPFILYGEIVDKQNHAALIGLVFPLVGIGLVIWAGRRVLEWRRFGAAPVALDPFPGAIGGHVGGTIDLNLAYDPATTFRLTLTRLRSYVSGSGKNRSRREEAGWQKTALAHAAAYGSGTRLQFRFDVPPGERESDVEPDDDYHLWRLNLRAELPGVDVDRDYEIPVFATGERSRHLASTMLDAARDAQERSDDASVLEVFRPRFGARGREIFFPAGRNLGPWSGAVLVGALFAGAGWFLIFHEGERLFGAVFGGVGLLIGLYGLYSLTNTLEVARDGDDIVTLRRLLGIPVARRRLPRAEVTGLVKKSGLKTQSGGRHVVYYSVFAKSRAGKKLLVGEGFRGQGQADAAMRYIANAFDLPHRSDGASPSSGDDAFDVLAADG